MSSLLLGLFSYSYSYYLLYASPGAAQYMYVQVEWAVRVRMQVAACTAFTAMSIPE
jgi:hypothetical protein